MATIRDREEVEFSEGDITVNIMGDSELYFNIGVRGGLEVIEEFIRVEFKLDIIGDIEDIIESEVVEGFSDGIIEVENEGSFMEMRLVSVERKFSIRETFELVEEVWSNMVEIIMVETDTTVGEIRTAMELDRVDRVENIERDMVEVGEREGEDVGSEEVGRVEIIG